MPKEATVFQGCWARELGGCNHKTNEHPFSKRILNGRWPVQRDGISLLSKSIPVGNLCDKHNGDLSDLDAVAVAYFNQYASMSMSKDAREYFPQRGSTVFSGWKLERFLAKCLIGWAEAGVGYDLSKGRLYFSKKQELVNYVFGLSHEPPPYPYGFWLRESPQPWLLGPPNVVRTTIATRVFNWWDIPAERWTAGHQCPVWLLLQYGALSPVHFGVFDLFPVAELGQEHLKDLAPMPPLPGSKNAYRPTKYGFSTSLSSDPHTQPEYVFEFDWTPDAN